MSDVTFELPADDMDRAMKFYREAFGWNSEKLPFDSALIDVDGNPPDPARSSGVFTKRNPVVTQPVLIIPVSSLDDAADKVKAAGGEMITPKERVGDFGFSAYGKDTEGTTFCLWEAL